MALPTLKLLLQKKAAKDLSLNFKIIENTTTAKSFEKLEKAI